MLKLRPISSRLFRLYAAFFSIFLSVLLLFFIFYVALDINRNIIATQEQMQQGMAINVGNYFDHINNFSLSLINSSEFRQITTQSLPNAYHNGKNTVAHFTSLYSMAYPMIVKGYKVGVLTVDGDYIWLGNNYFINHMNNVSFEAQPFSQVSVYVTESNEGLAQYVNTISWLQDEIEKSLCLTRTIFLGNSFSIAKGQLEVYVRYTNLEKFMRELASTSSEGMLLSLYDKNSNAIYTQGEDLSLEDRQKLSSGTWESNGQRITSTPLLSGEIYMISQIQVSKLYSSLYVWILMSVAAFLLLNLLLIWVTYKMSIKFTRPIAAICKQIDHMELDNNIGAIIETDVIELNTLSQTIVNMHLKLRDSLAEIVQLKSFEIQSRMLALQAQMQPHFLYNTLATIGSLAEQEKGEQAARITYNLTSMLRYISVEQGEHVSLADELKHVARYVDIMMIRFPSIGYAPDVPVEMLAIRIPRLLIQPMVENSIKYCERSDCQIALRGEINGNSWRISVIDNGRGFSQTQQDEFLRRMETMIEEYRTASLQIDGMGLANIYMRLWILYGPDMEFVVKNNPDGGCHITIGGLVETVRGEKGG